MTTLTIKEWYWTPALKSVQVLAEVADTQGWYYCSDGNQYQDSSLNRIHPHTGAYASSPIEVLVEVDFTQFQKVLKKVVPFRKQHYGKKIGTSALEGVLLMCRGDKVQIMGCDGNILALIPIDAKCTASANIVLRFGTIKSVLSLSCAGLLTIVRKDGKEFLKCGDMSLFQDTVTLCYPNISKVMPKNQPLTETLTEEQVCALVARLRETEKLGVPITNISIEGVKFDVLVKRFLKILKLLSNGCTVTASPASVIMVTDTKGSIFLIMSTEEQ
jgi:hypothetical protein